MDKTTKLALGALFILICLWFVKNYLFQSNEQSSLEATLHALQNNTSQTVKIYGPAHIPQTITGETFLKIYGIQESVIDTNTAQDLLEKIPTLKQENISNLTVPIFVLPNGEVEDSKTIYAALAKLPVVNLHPGKESPYIILYGVANCPYTASAKQQLDSLEIPYEYVDLNSDAARYMGELQARLTATGYTEDNYNTPLLEINGYIRPRDYVPDMISHIKVKK